MRSTWSDKQIVDGVLLVDKVIDDDSNAMIMD